MARAIYEKAIYTREKQTDRAVYKNHKRNVIPVVKKYKVVSATVSGEMHGYQSGEVITVLGGPDDTAAVLTVTAAEGVITELAVTEAGLYAEDIAGELSTYSYEGTGEGAVITVVTEAVEL